MPWKEVLRMEQRVSFVLKVQEAEKSFAVLCREFGISRKTGYKWWERFGEAGLCGLGERSSRPHRSPARSAPKWRPRGNELRERYPWGGPKERRGELVGRHREGGGAAARAP